MATDTSMRIDLRLAEMVGPSPRHCGMCPISVESRKDWRFAPGTRIQKALRNRTASLPIRLPRPERRGSRNHVVGWNRRHTP